MEVILARGDGIPHRGATGDWACVRSPSDEYRGGTGSVNRAPVRNTAPSKDGAAQESQSNLTYRRIQYIQMSRGLLQRWLGPASLQPQTASGGGGGIRDPDGQRGGRSGRGPPASDGDPR